MKKLRLFSVTILILLFALASVHAQQLYPTSHDFGDVEVGEAVTTIVTLSNDGFNSILLDSYQMVGDDGFSVTASDNMPYSLQYLDFIDFEVTFTPPSVGEFSADLVIQNGEQFIIPISGTGVPSSPSTIEDIIDNFDVYVANGTLVGSGSGNSADGRLNALRNMLVRVSYKINAGNYNGVCGQLNAVLKRCNDFVEGASQDALIQMISSLMSDLGC